MRYISRITAVPEGLTSSLLHVSFGMDDERFSLVLHDMEKGTDEEVRPSSLPYRQGVLGYVEKIHHVGGVVVKHSEKTATLHKYIKGIGTKSGAPAMLLLSADSCSIYDRNVSETGRLHGRPTVAVNTYNTIFKVGGELGSVVVKQPGGGSAEILTLYDTLGYVCSQIGLNLMTYNEIQLYSELYKYKTTIELEHSKEADRFFMKMFLDVMR